jgi:ABC-type uncharacterized transport system permease subunit
LGENKIPTVIFPVYTPSILQTLNLLFADAVKKLNATSPAEFGEDSMDG